MGFAYLYEGNGAVKKRGTMLGLETYVTAGNMLMIFCTSCGFVAKSFLIEK